MPRKFETDDLVYAKWPGSSQYFKANVSSFSDGKYEVKFVDDGTIAEVVTRHLMTQDEAAVAQKPRSPARRRSRSASPGRRRSRSRSPSRKKTTSPVARQPRSPARVARKLNEENTSPKGRKSPRAKKVASEKDISVKEDEKGSVEEIKSSELISSTQQSTIHSTSVTRRRTRSVSRALRDESQQVQSPSKSCSVSGPLKVLCQVACFAKILLCFIGGVIALVLPVAFTYGMFLTCKTKKSCTFLAMPTIPAYGKFFNWKSMAYVFGWFLFQLGLSSLPLGKMVTGPPLSDGKRLNYCLNGMAQFLITMALFSGLVCYGKFPYKYITVNFLSLVTAAAIYALVVSIVVYVLSRQAGPHEPSNGFVADFVKGRIISPRLCPYVDFKMYGMKSGAISWVILNLCYLIREIYAGKDVLKTNSSMVILQTFQLWYTIDLLFFEEALLYTATLSKEKMGGFSFFFMIVSFPFSCVQQVRYLVLFPVTFPWHMNIVPVLLHVVGYYIYRTSALQKFLFRKDLKKANELGVKSIPTKDGRSILVDGFWASLRHPNYTGDFMMILGWSLLCGVSHLLPWIWIITLFFTLVAMAKDDDEKCFQKYGPSWQEYRERVKYKFIPYLV